MDEAAAAIWARDTGVSRETRARFEELIVLLRAENAQQNLISKASLEQIMARHIVDSAQLFFLAPDAASWLDLGSGAGFPGLVIAILSGSPVTLIESRRLRADWLVRAADHLALTNVRVCAMRVEAVDRFTASVITARAFAPLPKLFGLAHRFSNRDTCWILPKGRTAAEELASVASTWHGRFEMKPSITDPDSAIIVAHDVQPIGARGQINSR